MRWIPPRLLANVLLVGLMVRLIGLPVGSIWLDEGATWAWATKPTWGETILAETNHPPLWWALTRLSLDAVGDTLMGLRLPAALFGLASVVLAWFLALRLLDPFSAPRRGGFSRGSDQGRGRAAAAWVAGIVAVSSYFVEPAQEARMYPALLTWALALQLLYLRWLDGGGRWTLLLYAVVGALGLYTHYFGVWPLLAHAAHALWLGRRTRAAEAPVRPLVLLLAVAAAGLAFLPWFLYLVGNYAGMPRVEREPFGLILYVLVRMGIGPGLVVIDGARAADGVGGVLAAEWPILALAALFWLLPLALGVRAAFRRPGLGSLAAANLLVPLASLLAIYPFFALLHDERYFLFLAPWVVVLVVLGTREAPRLLRPILQGGLALLVALGVVAYQGASDALVPEPGGRAGTLDGRPVPARAVPDPETPLALLHHGHPFGRTPWSAVHAWVLSHPRPDALVLLDPWYLHLAWDYYQARAKHPVETLRMPRSWDGIDDLERAFGARVRRADRVFLVASRDGGTRSREALRRLAARAWGEEGHGISIAGPTTYALGWGITVEVYTRQ